MNTQPQPGHLESIALDAIRPSTTNPRKHFAPDALGELTASIQENGVSVPITVRPWYGVGGDSFNNTKAELYEIVSGERRWRAAQAAGLDHIPAIVRELSDADALDVQMIENLQRADLHPVEEAEGYRGLAANGHGVEEIAKRTGKTAHHVAKMLKLLSLEVDAKQIFADGHMTLGHALLLARLTPANQLRAMHYLLKMDPKFDKRELAVVIDEKQQIIDGKVYANISGGRMIHATEREFKQWIEGNVLLQLAGVPWDLGDAELLPIAGACTTCPKRAGANQVLFADITTVADTCLDGVCFATKQKAQVLKTQEMAELTGGKLLRLSVKQSCDKLPAPVVELQPGPLKGLAKKGAAPISPTLKAVVVSKKAVKEGQWVESTKGACAQTVQAVYTDGPKMGKTRYVCADQACKVHKHRVETPKPKAPSAGVPGESFDERRKREEKELARQRAIEEKFHQAFEDAAMAVDAAKSRSIEKLLGYCIAHIDGFALDAAPLCAHLGITVPGYKPGGKGQVNLYESNRKAVPLFEKWLHEEATLPELHDAARAILVFHAIDSYDEDDLSRVAKMYGVDVQEIRDRIADEAEAEAAASKPKSPVKEVGGAKKKPAPGAVIASGTDGKSLGAGAGVEARS